MKNKIVLWGNDGKDEKVLIAMELLAKENKVNVHTFNHEIVSEVFYNLMMDDWRGGKEVEFPEGFQTQVRELSVTDDILPEDLKVQRGDLINRAKAEWHFVVLSTKMYDLYKTELEDLKDRIEKLVDFDGGIWEEVKGFWGKVSEQSRERNLFRDHADKLKNDTNDLFTKLKEFRTKANEELNKLSKEHVAAFTQRLDSVRTKVDEGKSLSPLFDELKRIQSDFKNTDFTRNDRSKVWKKIDQAFKKVKEKKYGPAKTDGSGGAVSRIERRHQGLMSAIGKMEQSIKRDKKDVDFQNKRVNETSGQLEMQIRQAKVKMIEERIQSKQDKLNEMLATQKELEKRMEKEKARAEKKAEKKEIQDKKEEVKEKIQAKISDNMSNLSEDEAAKLSAAAQQLNRKPTKKAKAESTAKESAETSTETPAEAQAEIAESKPDQVQPPTKNESESAESSTEVVSEDVPQEKESLLGAATAILGDAVENVVDSVKAVAAVVSDKVEDGIESLTDGEDNKESLTESASEEDKTTSDVKETLAKGGLLAGAVALGSKLVQGASEKVDELSETMGLDDTIDKAKDALQESKDAIANKIDDAQKGEDSVNEDVANAVESEEPIAQEPEKGGLGDIAMKGGLLGAAVALGSKVVETVTEKVSEVAEELGLDDALEQKPETETASLEESVDEVAARVKEGDIKGSAEEE